MSEHSPWSCVLFDIDGTLADSAPVVTRAFEQALRDAGEPVPPADRLKRYVGPPLWWSFDDLGYVGARAAELISRYKELYDQSYLEPPAFPGTLDLVKDLRADGYPLATASSKDDYMAQEQMRVLGFGEYLHVVAGATASRECTKATVIADALRRLEEQGHDVSSPVLIGDSVWDIRGGREAGLPVIAVGWGYPGGDLSDADAFAPDMDALRSLLLSGA